MNTRFYNARILKLKGLDIANEMFEVIEGEVWVEGNRITHVGRVEDGKESPKFDKEIDAEGNLLMPGFKNAHTHSPMTFLRSYADDMPLHDWLHKQVFPMEAKLTGEDIYHLSKLANLEYLTSGITSNLDMYYHPEEVARASVDMGFRTVINGSVTNFTGSVEDNIKYLKENFDKLNSYNDLISFKIGFHAEYTCSGELLEAIADLANELKEPVYAHSSETQSEVDDCIKRYGKTPTKYFDSIGMYNYGGGAYHCVFVTEEDLDIMLRKNVSIVHNPSSNLKLASGIAKVQRMVDLGINLAIGTDGPASNNALDMFREMWLTTALQKVSEKNAAAVDADKVLYMATKGGAMAMGLSDVDTLEVGKLADIIMIDLNQPNMQPINNITKNIVYSGSKQNVKLTMVDGKILYKDNEFFVNADPKEIYAKANEIIKEKKRA
ncbi:MAG: amidohydrolase [Clostridiales bacterium]|nr:amidohydrolase [Clostridiales bacterium]